MTTIISVVLFVVLAEILRRCCMAFILAFTGPLAKVPGPLLNKLSIFPWLYQCLTGNMINIAPDYFEKYGDIVRIAPREVIVAEKKAIHKIMIEEDFKKSPVYEAIREEHHVTNLFTETDKAKYKHKRRLLSPGFSISYLNGLEPLMQECLAVFVKVLNSRCEDGSGSAIIDMPAMMGNLTSDVMSATSFGGSFNLLETNDTWLKGMFNEKLKRAAIDGTFPFLKHIPFFPPSIAKEMNKMIDGIINKRRQDNMNLVEKGSSTKDLVQIFLDTHEADPIAFSEAHIREEMFLFMIAGSDTTSVTTTFLILLLLNNPEKLELLVAEIDEAFPSKNDAITFVKTQDLPYLNAVINESMRVVPILMAGLARQTTENTTLCNYEIPAGTSVAAYISEMMTDARYWPDGKSFIPERWLQLYKGAEVDRKAYMPFSAGSRNCIGQQFALKELRLIVAVLIRNFDLILVPGQSHKLRVFTVPQFVQGHYHVKIKPRA